MILMLSPTGTYRSLEIAKSLTVQIMEGIIAHCTAIKKIYSFIQSDICTVYDKSTVLMQILVVLV